MSLDVHRHFHDELSHVKVRLLTMSGEAEADFDKGYRINLDATRNLFEAIRKVGGGYKPKVVFTSSIAVFGAPFPEAIPDEFFNTPL